MIERKLTIAICTYNRAERLPALVQALRAQECPIPFELLFVNNNSRDDTLQVLEKLAAEPGAALRFVTESRQGIVPARNRAIAEALDSEYFIFIDDDETPRPGFLLGALRCFDRHESAACLGGRVKVDFSRGKRPVWLDEDLLGFLAETDYGDEGFWIRDESTPVWTANVAYRMSLFRDNPDLRFDHRYNREGQSVAGGEDVLMFRTLLKRGIPIRYCPDMVVDHAVEPWRLHRSYFLKLHCSSGFRTGRWELETYPKTFFGIPLFLFRQLLAQFGRTFAMMSRGRPGVLRQAMNVAHAVGMMAGCHARWREGRGYGREGASPKTSR
jgi:glycosyltransferase involved in cell wall biosynthesis